MKKIDPKYIGVPNICFSILKKDDKREKEFSKQRIERGFDNSELWNLDITICKFIIPRLEAFIEVDPFIRTDEWKSDVQKVLNSLKKIASDDYCPAVKDDQLEQDLTLFPKIFFGLWL